MGRKRTIAITILAALMVILAGCEENRRDEMILVSQDEIIYDKANETIDFDNRTDKAISSNRMISIHKT